MLFYLTFPILPKYELSVSHLFLLIIPFRGSHFFATICPSDTIYMNLLTHTKQ